MAGMRLTPALQTTLDADPNVCVALDADGFIQYVNPAWTRHADEANASPSCRLEAVLHRRYVDFVVGPLRPSLEAAIANVMRGGNGAPSRPETFIHSECNTPQWLRHLTTHLTRIGPAEGTASAPGLLLRHFLRIEGPLERQYELTDAPAERFQDANGLLLQCSCCRRAKVPGTEQWKMSLALFEPSPLRISHGLCGSCLEAYYPEPSGA